MYAQEELVGRWLTGKHVYMSEINLENNSDSQIKPIKYPLVLLTLLQLNLQFFNCNTKLKQP